MPRLPARRLRALPAAPAAAPATYACHRRLPRSWILTCAGWTRCTPTPPTTHLSHSCLSRLWRRHPFWLMVFFFFFFVAKGRVHRCTAHHPRCLVVTSDSSVVTHRTPAQSNPHPLSWPCPWIFSVYRLYTLKNAVGHPSAACTVYWWRWCWFSSATVPNTLFCRLSLYHTTVAVNTFTYSTIAVSGMSPLTTLTSDSASYLSSLQ